MPEVLADLSMMLEQQRREVNEFCDIVDVVSMHVHRSIN